MFSEKSKKLITDTGNAEIFELCETSSKKQCTDCALYCEIGIAYCSCGRSLQPSQRTKQLDKKNYDASSSKRTNSVAPNMELPSGNACTTRPRRCCRKLANPSMVVTKRFWKDCARMTQDRKSLSDIGWTEEQITQHDELALEDHSYFATREERTQTRKIGYSR